MTSPSKPCDRCKGRGEVDYGPYEDIQMIPCPQCKVTDTEIVNAMQMFGGHFVSHLGQLWHFADDTNRARIKAAWPELWMDYENNIRLQREKAKA